MRARFVPKSPAAQPTVVQQPAQIAQPQQVLYNNTPTVVQHQITLPTTPQQPVLQQQKSQQLYIDEYGQTYTLEEETYVVGPSGQLQTVQQQAAANTTYLQQQQQSKSFDSNENILKKAELSLAENIRFLQQLQTQALPPISKSNSITITPTTENQPKSWIAQNSNSIANQSRLPTVTPKKSALKKTSYSTSSVPYLNYANSFLNGHIDSGSSSTVKTRKKSVQIVLERNRMHVYTPEIW